MFVKDLIDQLCKEPKINFEKIQFSVGFLPSDRLG